MSNLEKREILKIVFSNKVVLIQIISLTLLWSLIQLSIPFLFKIAIDQGVSLGDKNFVKALLLTNLFLVILSLGILFTKDWLLRHLGSLFLIKLLKKFFLDLTKKDFLFYKASNHGLIIQNANDSVRVEKFFTDSLFTSFNAWFKIILFNIVLFFFNIKIGIVYFLGITLMTIYPLSIWNWKGRVDAKLFKYFSQVRQQLIELSNGIIDIKLYQLTELFEKKWNNLQVNVAKSRLTLLITGRLMSNGIAIISQAASITILLIACYGVIEAEITFGSLVAIQYIILQSGKNTQEALQIIPDYQEASLSLKRMSKISSSNNKEDKGKVPPPNHINSIEFSNVSFLYPKSDKGIHNISLPLNQGAKIGLIGESGSGKSTFLKVLAKIHTLQKGKIRVNNLTDLKDINTDDWYKKVMYISQDSYLFNDDVGFNISLTHRKEDRDINKIKKSLTLSTLLKKGTNKEELDKLISTPSSNFSAGQRQRLLIARAIYYSSELLLFDEPTNALDNESAVKVIENINNIYSDKIVIIATHKIHLLTTMDQILVIENGKLLKSGTPKEIFGNLNANLYG